MYRYHESREDTIIFGDFRNLLSKKEYEELGEKFEDEEHKIIGKHGYNQTLHLVEVIEKYFDIYDISKLTDEIKKLL